MIHNVHVYYMYNIIGISFIGVVCCNHKMSGGYFKYILPSTQGVGGGGVLIVDIEINHKHI